MLLKLQRLSLIAAAMSVAAFFLLLSIELMEQPYLIKHLDGTLTRTEVLLSKFYAVASNVDKTSKVISDSSKAQADGVTDTLTQARGTLSAAQDTIQGLQATATKIDGTADALTGTLNAGTTLLSTTNTQVQQVGPVLSATTSTVNDLDSFLRRNAGHFDSTLANVDQLSTSSVGIMQDFQKVTDKATADYLEPKPWYKKAFRFAGDGIDLMAFTARHY